ncbi:MAG TPA: hypothetical protein VFT82_02270 [Candidatus Paceibacterota bacterium]|nr:hypothetical protein [Candidatus Paceibacterota bacterium]
MKSIITHVIGFILGISWLSLAVAAGILWSDGHVIASIISLVVGILICSKILASSYGRARDIHFALKKNEVILALNTVNGLYQISGPRLFVICRSPYDSELNTLLVRVESHEMPEGGIRDGCKYQWNGEGLVYYKGEQKTFSYRRGESITPI